MKVVKTCNCGKRNFTKEEVIKLIKINIRFWETGFIFECDLCRTTLFVNTNIIDVLDLVEDVNVIKKPTS